MWQLLLKWWRHLVGRPATSVETYEFNSTVLGRKVRIEVYLPPVQWRWQPLPLVLFNDGQDLPGMGIRDQLEREIKQYGLPPLMLVGIYAGDRLREYGTADQLDYAGRGDLANSYEQFISDELLPFIDANYVISPLPEHRAIAGFSMGGLSAMDLVWRNADQFHTAGVFSGALWWRSEPYHAANPDAHRIMHERIYAGMHQPGLRFWFQTGTLDETADRNHNGIIDAIDDTLHLMDALQTRGYVHNVDMKYVEVTNGRHEPATWASVLPNFLHWWLRGV